MSQSLLAFDTNHIKSYVFGTNRLKEIRGASSILDKLNREWTVNEVNKVEPGTAKPIKIYAHGGSALFVVDASQAVKLGQAVQKMYHKQTHGGASITYAVQDIPAYGEQDIMDVAELNGNVTMIELRKLLSVRLRLAKDNLHMTMQQEGAPTYIAEPSHPLLCTCESCGVAYAQDLWKDPDDVDDNEGRYCRVCLGKRREDISIKRALENIRALSQTSTALWDRIRGSLGPDYLSTATPSPGRPNDFNVFRNFTRGKEYLGLVYADVNNMGQALQNLPTLREVQKFAEKIDNAVFEAMGYALSAHLPLVDNTFPFDILLIGGDDIVLVAPADKALQVAQALGEKFYAATGKSFSIGVVLAPIKYPFRLQYMLVNETIKAAKKDSSKSVNGTSLEINASNQTRINFVVVTGNTSLSYQKQYEELHRKKTSASKHEFYATLRPYTLADFGWLLAQLRAGNQMYLGRTKLYQLREAILKLNRTTTIVDALALLRNWNDNERIFMKQMVQNFDTRQTQRQKDMGPLFPWYLDSAENDNELNVYRTPLLDFIELYDFVMS